MLDTNLAKAQEQAKQSRTNEQKNSKKKYMKGYDPV